MKNVAAWFSLTTDRVSFPKQQVLCKCKRFLDVGRDDRESDLWRWQLRSDLPDAWRCIWLCGCHTAFLWASHQEVSKGKASLAIKSVNAYTLYDRNCQSCLLSVSCSRVKLIHTDLLDILCNSCAGWYLVKTVCAWLYSAVETTKPSDSHGQATLFWAVCTDSNEELKSTVK